MQNPFVRNAGVPLLSPSDPSTAMDVQSLQQKQALINMLKQSAMQQQQPQNYGAIASRVSPITPIIQALSGYLAKGQQNDLNQQSADLYKRQQEQALGMMGGGPIQAPSVAPQAAPADPYSDQSQDAMKSGDVQQLSQAPQPEQSQLTVPLRDPKFVTSMNPGGFEPHFAARMYQQLGPEKFSSQFIEPFVKPVEAQHTREGLVFDPRTRKYFDADGRQLTDQQVQDRLPNHDSSEKPMDELAKLNADFQAGRMSKQDYDARKLLMTTRAPNMYSDTGDNSNSEDVAKMIAEYRLPPPSAMRMQTPQGLALMAKVNRFNPDYHGEEYPTRVAAYKAFGSGKQGDQVRAFNVGISHLNTAGELADALGNGDVRLINKVAQRFAEETGSEAPTNFDTAKQVVKSEIVKAVVGGQASQRDREEALAGVDKASSPAQLKGAIITAQKLMGGQMGGLKRQYEQSTGRKDFERLLSEDAKPYLTTKEGTGNSQTKAPQAAIDHLKQHPELADQFKAKYGYLP